MLTELQQGEIQDLNFILSSWLKSYQKYSVVKDKSSYFALYGVIIKHLIENNYVYVARSNGVICGWIVFSDTTLHYVYVKSTYRGFGLLDELMSLAPNIQNCSFRTKSSQRIKQLKNLTYNISLQIGE